MAGAVIFEIFKEVGWEVPYRWLCIVGFIAYIADKIIK